MDQQSKVGFRFNDESQFRSVLDDIEEVGTPDTRYSEEAERKLSDEVLKQYRRENNVEEKF